jgi:hypothetical protein
MIGRYQIGDQPVPGFVLKAKLGEGSFGAVWSATGPGGSEVAVKFINLQRSYGDKELRALRLVKRIRHPNVVPLTGFWLQDESGNLIDEATADRLSRTIPDSAATLVCDETMKPAELIVVMGLGDMSLEDRLRECQRDGLSGIPVDELLGYMEDAARAIDFLNKKQHQSDHGLVAIQHCDIKPQNILIVGGSAQVCDLGLARILDDARQTRAAFSAAYGAPECLTGSSPSQGTDQYSLAVSYVELRTGQLPFDDTSSHARVIQAHLENRLDLSRLSPGERSVIRRATAIDPADRFESVSAMVAALKAAVESRPETRRSTVASFGRRAAMMLAIATVAVGGVSGWHLLYCDHGVLALDGGPYEGPAASNESRDEHETTVLLPAGEPNTASIETVEPLPNQAERLAETTPEVPIEEAVGNPVPEVPVAPAEELAPSHVLKWLQRKRDDAIGKTRSTFLTGISALRLSIAGLNRAAVRHLYEQAIDAATAGDHRAAIQRFGSILQYDRHHVPSHIQRGLSLAHLGQMDAAVRDYSLAIDSESENPDARRLRGIAFARKGQYVDALQDLNVAILNHAQPLAVCYRTRALVHLQLEDFVAALSDQEELKRLDSDMLLVLTLRVSKSDAFAELDTGENVSVETGKTLRLLRVSDQRLRVEFQDDDETKTGWIHQSFVKPAARL